MTFMSGRSIHGNRAFGNQNRWGDEKNLNQTFVLNNAFSRFVLVKISPALQNMARNMAEDWADAWLQKVAGWKAVKSGLAMAGSGLVKEANFDGAECRAIISGVKPRRVRVKRIDDTKAETFCYCAENQRTGAMCEHAVAAIIVARGQGKTAMSLPQASEKKPTIVSKSTVAKEDRRALRVELFPRWKDEWKAGRLSAKIVESNRTPDESDASLLAWLRQTGVSQRPMPWMLSMPGTTCEEFLEAISGHSEVICQSQTIVCGSEFPAIHVRCRPLTDKVEVVLVEPDAERFGGKRSGFYRIGEHLFQTNDRNLWGLFDLLFAEKLTNITHAQLFSDNDLFAKLVDQSGWIEQIAWKTLEPSLILNMDGNLQGLRLQCRWNFQHDTWNQAREHHEEKSSYLLFKSNVCYVAGIGCRQTLLNMLSHQGWEEIDGAWLMRGEDRLLAFFQSGRDKLLALSGAIEETSALKRARSSLVVLRASIEQRNADSQHTALSLQFTSQEGRAFDALKIRSLLESGKRLIQTNDGKTLLLPKESWEVFLQTARDLQFEQRKGEFLAKNTHALVIDYLRKYCDKSFDVNQESKSNDLAKAIDFPGLNATLREYQWQGVNWLRDRLSSHGFALLADEMGLGKTLQTIALLLAFARPDDPGLVVVPTSLLRNWEVEIAKFAPSLKTIVWHGGARGDDLLTQSHSVIVTSYGVLVKDRAFFMKRGYSVLVLDEASMIRNPDTEAARACYRMQAQRKIALTGTPLENSMQDLWSIFQFLQPGYLGDRKTFRERYERVGGDAADAQVSRDSLKLRVMPFILRRTKEEVAKDLPEKLEYDQWCEMSADQTRLYQSVLDQGLVKIDSMLRAGDSAARMSLLTLLLRLRQICCDAALYDPSLVESWTMEQRSAKLEQLFRLIEGSMESGRKMLIFSQFAKQLHVIQAECEARGLDTLRLDGATRDRQALVQEFQKNSGPPIFLISLKAGGYGLNLTNASTVIHFDPWWNPAAERQASDRAHRIGQTQRVQVYRLLTRGTVEERVKKMQAEKSAMADQLFGAVEGSGLSVNLRDLEQIRNLLLQP
jgi:superfamily II DNA or RNA helicase